VKATHRALCEGMARWWMRTCRSTSTPSRTTR
jgi:hypothetical protein